MSPNGRTVVKLIVLHVLIISLLKMTACIIAFWQLYCFLNVCGCWFAHKCINTYKITSSITESWRKRQILEQKWLIDLSWSRDMAVSWFHWWWSWGIKKENRSAWGEFGKDMTSRNSLMNHLNSIWRHHVGPQCSITQHTSNFKSQCSKPTQHPRLASCSVWKSNLAQARRKVGQRALSLVPLRIRN